MDLGSAVSDILILLDCCASGGSRGSRGFATRDNKELIAACGFETSSPAPGRHSFTKSLIEELWDLSKSGPFTAAYLHDRMSARLQHWSPYYDADDLKRRDVEGRDIERRNAPVHFFLNSQVDDSSIVLRPFPRQSSSADVGDLTRKEISRILRDRNISLEKSEDDRGSETFLADYLDEYHIKPTAEEEKDWESDLAKCDRSDEETSKIIMMSTIFDHHNLGDSLDYSFLSLWRCERMPFKTTSDPSQLSLPRPDLVIAFSPKSLITSSECIRLGDLTRLIFVEGRDNNRAFPFFSMQLNYDASDTQAVHQNLYTASQGLHNLYCFMSVADDEEVFFKMVRSILSLFRAEVMRYVSTER